MPPPAQAPPVFHSRLAGEAFRLLLDRLPALLVEEAAPPLNMQRLVEAEQRARKREEPHPLDLVERVRILKTRFPDAGEFGVGDGWAMVWRSIAECAWLIDAFTALVFCRICTPTKTSDAATRNAEAIWLR
jgi:hypothetical protein